MRRLSLTGNPAHGSRMSDEHEEIENFEDAVSAGDQTDRPNEAADPSSLVEATMPPELMKKYEIYSYRSAATILAMSHKDEFKDLCDALMEFTITESMIRTAGGNESEIPKLLSAALRPKDWRETIIRGDLHIQKISKKMVLVGKKGKPLSKPRFEPDSVPLKREKYLDGHKVDYVKGKVAFDLEWNSKDQTFDRDLYAFSAFAQTGVVDVGVLVTRGTAMTDYIRGLGPALKKNGEIELKKDGTPRRTSDKYGASTTWMGKLLYRLNAGRNGACPVLVIGITPACVTD